MYVEDIREGFRQLKETGNIRKNGTYEMRGVSFTADSPYIFGTPNQDYINAEIQWYDSYDDKDNYSTSVDRLADIYGKRVKIWDDVCNDQMQVNSHYGSCIYRPSMVNKGRSQYECAIDHLWDDPTTRQAVMYYTPQYIHHIAKEDGMNDHICTSTVQYFVNDHNYLEVVVNMRSNDAIFGYANDIAWQKHVQYQMCRELSHAHLYLRPGPITWQVGSLHIYPRHFSLIV